MSINEIQLINCSGEELLIIMTESNKGIVQRIRTVKNKDFIYLLSHFGRHIYETIMFRDMIKHKNPELLEGMMRDEYQRHHRIKIFPNSGFVYVNTCNYSHAGTRNEYYGYFQEINRLLQQLDLN